VRTANIEFGINLVDNFTIHPHMITLSQASSGHLMEIISQLALSRCSDFAIDLDGLTPSTSQSVDPFSASHGAMMVPLFLELVEMDKSYSAKSSIEHFPGLTLKQFLIKITKSKSMIAFMRIMMTLTSEKES
jgi:hypothetical protein